MMLRGIERRMEGADREVRDVLWSSHIMESMEEGSRTEENC